ncbi:DUF6314 family protein [Saccharopolyspora sp. NFXS83]|uniref:DUF6314 family protein n=1 Tax=Saccharopolyspora sp. NFXS83 TaxID=2993560 RepID=UPI00224A55E0|nr:DUF6314 family protein [Saccharopolyspora sp. NFXS83]MCX2732589.1 DUF6314 family protein [Saccharopolyspora sp. NFXS83]
MTEGFAVADVAGFFAGTWGVVRGIVDDSGARLGGFEGEAVFAAEPGGLLVYRERGELVLGAHRGSAQRTLHYRVTGPGRASVFFDYGDFFHDLDLRSGRWRVEHPCRADVYRGEFVVSGPDSWWQQWRVAGPAKAHTLTTDFARVAG